MAFSTFDESDQPKERAARFVSHWRRTLFSNVPAVPLDTGYVYVPLQGRLLSKRSFQTCSPVQMIEDVLAHDPARRIFVTLHPGEYYSENELDAVAALAATHDRVSLHSGGMNELLPHCDYVVAQNSSVGLLGYFLHKPLVLFAAIDFHHIAANVSVLGETAAFEQVQKRGPDYDSYLWWFFQKNSINAKKNTADKQIVATLRSAGWPL